MRWGEKSIKCALKNLFAGELSIAWEGSSHMLYRLSLMATKHGGVRHRTGNRKRESKLP
jgi:hypothetical protein